jgi:hypothetical protein
MPPHCKRFGRWARASGASCGGNFIDPNDALADFDPRYISDGQLGAP